MRRAISKKDPLRVVLVALPFKYFPNSWRYSKNYTRPPLGIAYLAGHLRERAGFPVDIKCLDLLAAPSSSLVEMRDRILRLNPDVVGFSVLTASQPLAIQLGQSLKAVNRDIFVVAGGPHITVLPDEPMPGIDARVSGEGELAFQQLIEEVVLGGSASPIPGVVLTLPSGEVVRGAPRALISDLDSLPLPARDLLDNESYFHSFPYRGVSGFTTMLTSRGCPFHCNFCANARIWGRTVRYYSVPRVLEEIDQVTRTLGLNLIFFDDDTFTADRNRVSALLGEIRRRHPRLRWICHTRVDVLDEELIREMAASGCVEVQVGVESGDPDVLRSTNKGVTLDQTRRSIRLLRRYGINVWATFVLGHALETQASIQRTIDTSIELDPTYASFIVLLPFPGTDVHEEYAAKGFLRTVAWEDYSWHGYPVFSTDALSADDLVKARARANTAFYLRPGKLTQLALMTLKAASLKEMSRNLSAWLSLVTFSPRNGPCPPTAP